MSATELAPQQEIRALYSDHHDWLQQWLRRRLGDTADATDLAQDVFMRILARRQAVAAREPRAYLSSIARGLVIDHWRRRELEQAWLATLATLPEPEAPSPESRALILEALVEIDRVLDSLQPAVRRAFLLAQLDGMTCPQIAQDLRVSLATAERYIAKALRRCYELQVDLDKTFKTLPPQLARAALDSAATGRLKSRRNALKLFATAGICAIGGLYTLREIAPWQRLLADASTGIGEQRTLHLADGTLLKLNTDSAVSTDLAGANRIIHLRRGEILIETGSDNVATKRPFWVRTPFGAMRALGTRFTVRLDEGGARVSVQEGAVELHPAAGSRSAIVHPGESYWLTNDQARRAEPRGFSDDAWADGVIAAKEARLVDVLAELSRYRRGLVTCDERVAKLRLSGVFHVRDTDQALQFLAQTQPIRVSYRSRFWVQVGPPQQ